MAICKAWPLLNNSNCQQSIICHPMTLLKASIVTESLNCPGASEEEPINSSCHHKLLFLCQLELPPIWPTESCLNEAYITQTCLSNRLSEVNASRPLPFHCHFTYTACKLSICGRSLQKRKNRKWWDSRKRGKWHCTSYPQTSWWWQCPGYWRQLRSAVLPWSGSQMSFCICQNSTINNKYCHW